MLVVPVATACYVALCNEEMLVVDLPGSTAADGLIRRSTKVLTLKGSPTGVGKDYGCRLALQIKRNLEIFVTPEAETLSDKSINAWVSRNESLLEANWPWLIEEMHGTAEGTGVPNGSSPYWKIRYKIRPPNCRPFRTTSSRKTR